MATVRELYEALEELLEDEAGSEVLIASQPTWPFENHIAEIKQVEFVEDHPFEGSNLAECETCGGNADDEDHQVKRQVYIVEGSQKGYLPGEAAKELGW